MLPYGSVPPDKTNAVQTSAFLPVCTGVAPDRVYSDAQSYQCAGELLPRLSILTFPKTGGRFISVALSLRSPSADVIRYPALRCPDFPHGNTFRRHTARQHSSVPPYIITHVISFVKYKFNKSILFFIYFHSNHAFIIKFAKNI